MTSKRETATYSHPKTSKRRLVKCPTCAYEFFTQKPKGPKRWDQAIQCSVCGARFD